MRGPGGWVHLLSPEPVPHVLVKVKEGELHPGDLDLSASVAPLECESKLNFASSCYIWPLQVDPAESGCTVRTVLQVIGSPGRVWRTGRLRLDVQVDDHARLVRHAIGAIRVGDVP